MTQVFNLPIARVFEDDGTVGAGYQLFFYETGTTTKKTVYSDEALTTPLTNPVVADANGEFVQIFLDGTGRDYKAVLGNATETDPPTSPIWTADPVDTFTFDVNSFDPRPFQHWGTTSGTSTAYTLTPTTAITAYADTMIFSMQPHVDNTGSSTLAVSGLTAINLKKYDNTSSKVDLEAGDLQAGQTYIVRIDSVDAVVLNPSIVEYTKTNKLNLNSNTATISSGAITYSGVYMTLDTEGATASDYLDTINGGVEGDILYIRIADNARNVILRHAQDNIITPSETNLVIDKTTDIVKLIFLGTNWVVDTSRPNKSALLTYQVASGTNGGSSTAGVWTTRALNTEVYDYGSIVSLSGNQFTLQPGIYKISASQIITPAGATQIGICKGRIRNITDSTTVALSLNYDKDIAGGFICYDNVIPPTIIGLEEAKVFQLQFYVTTALAGTGLGKAISSGENEVYASVYIETLN